MSSLHFIVERLLAGCWGRRFMCIKSRSPDLPVIPTGITRTRITYSEVQVAQVRYNEVWLIGCPSSLGSFSSATTNTFVCLVICPFCVHMCLPPFRAGWRSHMPPFGEACVCNPWNHRDPFGLVRFAFSLCVTAGGLVVHASTSPTKRLALNTDIGGDADRRTCIFSFPDGMRLSQEPH